jgi:hypothetical protein
VGFDFLGWHIRQHPVGKHRCGKNTSGTPLGFKTIITPSKDAQKRHLEKLAAVLRKNRAATQADLILQLNRVIRGWTRYHATSVSARVFRHMQALLFGKLLHWAKRRQPKKSSRWVTEKYWHTNAGSWSFHTTGGARLSLHTDTPITRHVKVVGVRSPCDGDWVYWSTRLGRHPQLPAAVASLLRKQHGRCAWCSLYFTTGDIRQRDHHIPHRRTLKGGGNAKQLLHGHCHDAKTAQDGSYARGTTDNSGSAVHALPT